MSSTNHADAVAKLIAAGLDATTAATVADELVPPEPVDPMRVLTGNLFGRPEPVDVAPTEPLVVTAERGTPDRSGGSNDITQFLARLFGR